MLVIAGWIRLDPEKHDDAVAAALPMMEATQAEAGCISYVFSADLADRGLFRLFEEWESQEALDAHFRAPHMAIFQKAMGGLGISETHIQKYQIASVGPIAG